MDFIKNRFGNVAPVGAPNSCGGVVEAGGRRIQIPKSPTLDAVRLLARRGLVHKSEIAPDTLSFMTYLGIKTVSENDRVGFAPGVAYVGELVPAK
jgi:hypothetical protein